MRTFSGPQNPLPSPLLPWLCTFCLLAVSAAPAHAMTLREMRALEKTEKAGRTYTDYYLVGVMEGVLEAHNRAVRSGAAPTICVHDRRLLPNMARGLFTTELKRNAELYEADMPVALVMRSALETVYACER